MVFYAVQQDYVSDGFPNKTFHISLAYKDKDFTFSRNVFYK